MNLRPLSSLLQHSARWLPMVLAVMVGLTPSLAVAQSFTLAGQIVADGDTPPASLEGLVVSVSPGQLSVETEETGEFLFSMLDGGAYTLSVDGPGILAVTQDVTLEADLLDLEVVVRAALRLEGEVVASDTGEAVKQAVVSLEDTAQRTMTDEEGEFVLEGLAPGVVTLRVTAPGFVSLRQEITLEQDDVSIDLTLDRAETYQLIVSVTNADGDKVEGAQVQLLGGLASSMEPVSSDADGQAVLANVSPGNYGLEIEAEGYQLVRIASIPVQENTSLSVMLVSTERVPELTTDTALCSAVPQSPARHAGQWWLVLGALGLMGAIRARAAANGTAQSWPPR